MNPFSRLGARAARVPAFVGFSLVLSATAVAQCAHWSNALGDFHMTHVSATPRDAIVYDDGSGAGPTTWVAYTGGSVESISFGGVARRVAGGWVETEPNTTFGATSLAIHDAGAGPELFVGGAYGVRRFTNGAWASVGLLGQSVQDLAVFDFGGGPALYAGGRDITAADDFAVAKLVGGAWAPIATGFGPGAQVYELAAFDGGAGPELYAAGTQLMPGSPATIVRLGAGGWTAVPMPGGSFQSIPKCLEVHDDGAGPRLLAEFRVLGAYVARIGAFDGSGWTMLPGEFSAGIAGFYPQISEITSHVETALGPRKLFVAGQFETVAGVPAKNVARWNGSSWSALSGGLTGWQGNVMRMLASLPGDASTPPRLVVGGWFEQADGLTTHRIAAWDGCASAGVVECAGDGSAAACPCGNFGATGAGCASSLGVGATLGTIGIASIGGDSLTLLGASMPNSSALYFQGTSAVQGGAGVAFGDGLRCAGGTLVRLAVVANTGGASAYPSAGDPSVSVRGQVTTPGTRHYQVWYRNAATFCTSSTFNFTNALSVAWQS